MDGILFSPPDLLLFPDWLCCAWFMAAASWLALRFGHEPSTEICNGRSVRRRFRADDVVLVRALHLMWKGAD